MSWSLESIKFQNQSSKSWSIENSLNQLNIFKIAEDIQDRRTNHLQKKIDNVHQSADAFKTTRSVNIQDYKEEIKIKRCIQVNEISQRFKITRKSS